MTATAAARFILTVRLTDGRIRFVNGQSVTARREHATRYATEDQAVVVMTKAAKWAGVKDVWTTACDD